MATPTERHAAAQQALTARTTRDLLAAWPTFSPSDQSSWPRFAAAAKLVIRERARQSGNLSAAYYERLRESLGIPGTASIVPPALPDHAQLDKSLAATGLVGTIAALHAGFPLKAALDAGFTRVARAAQRHVMNAGRETLVRTSLEDPAASGWERVTKGTCDFCEERAAEGAVDFDRFPSHDGCQCSAEPVFDTATIAELFQELSPEAAADAFAVSDDLGPALRQEVNAYAAETYEQLNAVLRQAEGDLSQLKGWEVQQTAGLDAALEVSASKTDAVLWRGLDFFPDGAGVGDFLTDDAFVSTSLSREVAESFAGNGRGYVLRIELPAGSKALFITTAEDEILLPRGSRFAITAVDRAAREVTLRVTPL